MQKTGLGGPDMDIFYPPDEISKSNGKDKELLKVKSYHGREQSKFTSYAVSMDILTIPIINRKFTKTIWWIR